MDRCQKTKTQFGDGNLGMRIVTLPSTVCGSPSITSRIRPVAGEGNGSALEPSES